MKTLVGSKRLAAVAAVLIGLTMLGLLWPLAAPSPGGPEPVDDAATITDLAATYQISTGGRLVATERLTVELPADRDDIIWYFPVADPTDAHRRIAPAVTGITMDDQRVPVDYSWHNGRSVYTARIGAGRTALSAGTHTIVINYTVDGVLVAPSDPLGSYTSHAGANRAHPESALFWNVIGFWAMPIRSARVEVELPAPAGFVQCAAEAGTGCVIEGADSARLTFVLRDLPARSPVAAHIDLPLALPNRAALPWGVRVDGILGRSIPVAALLIGVSLLAGAAGLWCVRRARESPPPQPICYEPPERLGPVQAVYIVTESIGEHALAGTVLYLAELKAVRLDATAPGAWTITGTASPQQWAALDPISQRVGRRLRVTTAGATFLLDRSHRAGAVLAEALDGAREAGKQWSEDRGLIHYSVAEWGYRIAVCLCALPALVGFIAGPTIWGLPFALFGVAGVGLFADGVGTRRTEDGRALWARVGGFQRLLAGRVGQTRFELVVTKDHYTGYLPYAVAFGLLDRWAAKYRSVTGFEPPRPDWFPDTDGFDDRTARAATQSGVAGFDAVVAGSVASYRAAQRAVSGAGGRSRSNAGRSW